MRITIGHVPVKLTRNGKRVKIPPTTGAIYYELTPSRAKVLPVGKRACTGNTPGTGTGAGTGTGTGTGTAGAATGTPG